MYQHKIDKYFLYKLPADLVDSLKIGMQVKVPFGKQTIKGFVLNIVANIPSVDYEIKEIIDKYF